MSDTAMYKKYRNFLRKLAWSYNKTSGIEFEELFSEATVGYVIAMNTYNKDKGVPLISWIALCVKSKLNNRLYYQKKVPCTFFDEDTEDAIKAPDTITAKEEWEDKLSKMSPEAKSVCEIILQNQTEYGSMNGRKARGQIRKVLREQNWTHEKIWATIAELKRIFQEGSIGYNSTI